MTKDQECKRIVEIVVKEIGYPDTKEKVEKMAKRIHELITLKEMFV